MYRSSLLAIVIAGSALAAAALAQPSSPEGGDAASPSIAPTTATSAQRPLRPGLDVPSPHQRLAMPARAGRARRARSRSPACKATMRAQEEAPTRNLPLPNGMRPDQPSPRCQVQRPPLPDDAEVNRAMAVMEKIWRRMVEMIMSVQRDFQNAAEGRDHRLSAISGVTPELIATATLGIDTTRPGFFDFTRDARVSLTRRARARARYLLTFGTRRRRL